MKSSSVSRGISLQLAIALGLGTYATHGLAQEADEGMQKPSEAIETVSDENENAQDEMDSMSEAESEPDSPEERRRKKRESLKAVGNLKAKKEGKKVERPAAVLGAGKTLPEGVMRVRLPYSSYSGEEGYDENGNREKQGYEASIQATALVGEYGITDRVSLQFVVPYILENKLGMNANDLRKNNYLFRRELDRYKGATANLLQQQGQCSSESACLALLDNPNFTVPGQQEITLTTGEKTVAMPNEPALRQIDKLLMRPITPLDGDTGIGDVQIGGLYNFYNDGYLSTSLGAGLRLPTGTFEEVPRGKRGTGGGITDFGLRFNVDWNPLANMVVSLQYQGETMLAGAKRKTTSALYNDRLNTGDPTDPAALAIGGTGKAEDDYEKIGIAHSYFMRVGYGLGSIASVLNPFSVNTSYNYFRGREVRLNEKAFDNIGYRYELIPWNRSVTVGAAWNGLAMKNILPLGVSVDHTRYIGGQNMTIAPDNTSFQLMGYYKF
jgi:hypothetical protein